MESDWEAAIIRPTVHGSAGGDGREVWGDACDGVGLGRKWQDGSARQLESRERKLCSLNLDW